MAYKNRNPFNEDFLASEAFPNLFPYEQPASSSNQIGDICGICYG
jgi:hypothetical protein